MIISMIGFTVLVLLVTTVLFYLIWMNKRQRLERKSYELHQLMQQHYQQMLHILTEIEPLMNHDKVFYGELHEYIKAHHNDFPTLGEVDGMEAKEFYGFLLHLEKDTKEHIKIFSSPITQQLDQMKLSLMRARESFAYADNEYRFAASSFPTNIMAKMLEDEKRGLQV